MLTYMLVVNDNGELKSINQEEFETELRKLTNRFISRDPMEQVINIVLDKRHKHEGEMKRQLGPIGDMENWSKDHD